MQYDYAKNRISEAIKELCIAPGDARSRLLIANDLTSSLNDNHFPDDLLPQWLDIKNMMRKNGPRKNSAGKPVDGAVSNTLRTIRNSTGSKIAEKFYDLHEQFQQEY
ncbi:hypothetical protein CMT41_07180 [Colwellia sp. MT41]|uniref:hypothetical protein n=1 Tax=Colwellia sp. MT41 TaxID=58049 RepID=UPI0007179CE1|nr:hypothetical protein [Colwellia sp. MT41]ALO34520.1 hypothetical protein CMT41_07180 [Colwellia sp. MT41]